MHPLNEAQIRAAFVNASRREAAQASLPALSEIRWDRVDYLGWRDEKRPQLGYVVVEVDGEPKAVLLRGTDPGGSRRKAVCAWCEDLVEVDDVVLFAAKRAGARGRRGDTVGTLICGDFRCSKNVRRTPTPDQVGSDDPDDRAAFTARRIAGLRERSTRFVTRLLDQADDLT